MLEWLSDPHAWIALVTLTALEIVLGDRQGWGFHIPKGYIYFSMAFAIGVEMLNIKARKLMHPPVKLKPRRNSTARRRTQAS